jgi:hypothetical protein
MPSFSLLTTFSLPHRIIYILVILLMGQSHPAWCADPITSAKTEGPHPQVMGTMMAIKTGDIFKGEFELLTHDQDVAELVVYFTETTAKGRNGQAFEVEAFAMVTTKAEDWIYGLSGTFDTKYKQLILYNIIEFASNGKKNPPEQANIQNIFRPVGFAGQISEDDQTITCSIAYNGDASLTRVTNSVELEEKLLRRVKSNFL